MKINYEVTTSIDPLTGDINQTLYSLVDDVREVMLRQMIRTQDDGIKEALINLGWTPPKDTK